MEENTQNTNEPVTPAEAGAQPTAEQDELTKAQSQATENLNGWHRALADYANLKKESEKAQREIAQYAAGSFIMNLLPSLEAFRMATAHRPIKEGEPLDEKRITTWVDGIGHVRTQIEQALAQAGVTPIADEGVLFDPNLHEAMLSEKREGIAPGHVLKVLESGCKHYDRVLKPARVVVSE